MKAENPWLLGLDLGATRLKALCVTADGTEIERTTAPSDTADWQASAKQCVASLVAVAFGWRNRGAVEPLPGPAWGAAILGGLAGGLIGSVVEDSGPLLLVSSVLLLLGAVYYLLGRPAGPEADSGESSVTG